MVAAALFAAGFVWILLKRWGSLLIRDIRGKNFLDDAASPLFALPILSQVRETLRDMERSQRLEIDYTENWTPQALQHVVQDYLQSPEVIVASNREPYIHMRNGKSIQVSVPSSGLVTALEPVLCACDGTWLAHGSGTADRETVDRHNRLAVPPDDPRYTLRRIWLTKEEEEGYYYGFANEGLWPLCHIAHTRPIFRASDWKQYQSVNRKFADALLE